MLAAIKHVVDDKFVFQQHSAWYAHHSSTAVAQNSQLHFLWAIVSNSQQLNSIDCKIYESYDSVSKNWQSIILNKSSSNCLNSSITLAHHLSEKMQFRYVALATSGGKKDIFRLLTLSVTFLFPTPEGSEFWHVLPCCASTVRDRKRSSITRNKNSTRAFQRAINQGSTPPLTSSKWGWST